LGAREGADGAEHAEDPGLSVTGMDPFGLAGQCCKFLQMTYLKYLLVFLLCIGAGRMTAGGQTTEDSVKAAVNELFIAMKNSDGPRLRTSFADSAILQTIITNKEGKTFARNESITDFAESIGKLPKGAADERIRFDLIRIDGPLAIVWAPYSFYFKEKFSHCGIDSFQLLRSGGVWRILYIVDTRRKDGCE
jgi:hypothetical protein